MSQFTHSRGVPLGTPSSDQIIGKYLIFCFGIDTKLLVLKNLYECEQSRGPTSGIDFWYWEFEFKNVSNSTLVSISASLINSKYLIQKLENRLIFSQKLSYRIKCFEVDMITADGFAKSLLQTNSASDSPANKSSDIIALLTISTAAQ